MLLFIGSIVIGVFFFSVAAEIKRNHDKHFIYVIPYGIIMGIGILFVVGGTFIRAEKTMRGAPLHSIGPGKYTVVGVAGDDSFVTPLSPITDMQSATYLILKGNSGNAKFYLLPANKLKGIPAEGGVLEVSEVPSSTTMVFRK